SQIASLNGQIVLAKGNANGGAPNALLDQRDAALGKLAGLLNIHVVDTGDGSVNVNVGSEALVLGTTNRGISTKIDETSGAPITKLVFGSNHGEIPASSGQLGALVGLQTKIQSVDDQVNSMAHNLIFELNKIHSSGQGLEGITQATS